MRKGIRSILGVMLCNARDQLNQNQFKQNAVVGQLDETTGQNNFVMDVRYNSEATSTNTLEPGEGVKLADLGSNDPGGNPFVDERTADGDAIYGVKIFSTKENLDSPGDVFSVAMEGAIIYMNASAAIARGALVALVRATEGDVVTRTTEEILGIALDKASAADDLIRVKITARGYAELALYELST
jgi:hypothetical protein